MNPSIKKKLAHLVDRFEEIKALLSDMEVISDQNKFRSLSKEYAQIEPIVSCFQQLENAQMSLSQAQDLKKDADLDVRALAEEEIGIAKNDIERLDKELEILLLPKDPDDDKDIYLEIRAGTGGNEASIFTGDLFRMYSRYAERMGWRIEVMNESEGEQGGFKEIVAKISGDNVYSKLKFESGAHRVQRVPVTESQGRVHTSACTVAVMPEVEEVDAIDIKPEDLKIDTYRASGAGGQHINKTDSAIRITHLPTGVVVECQDERSQHKNKARALSVLQAKLLQAERDKQQAEQAATRKSLVGSGDRSERIRTYNYPQSRVTDHRINLTLYKLPEIMEGALDQVIDPLIQEHQAELLASLSNDEY